MARKVTPQSIIASNWLPIWIVDRARAVSLP